MRFRAGGQILLPDARQPLELALLGGALALVGGALADVGEPPAS